MFVCIYINILYSTGSVSVDYANIPETAAS